MKRLISLCVRRNGAAVTLSAIALALGLWGASGAALDVFPEFVPSQVTIETSAPGFTAEEVEELVTHPIEKGLNGSEGVAVIRSESVPGISLITINFAAGASLYHAQQDITERLARLANELPTGARPPQLSPLTSSTRDLVKIGLVSDQVDAYSLRDTADYVIKPRLLALAGVARVDVFGGKVRQIQIQADPKKLAAFGFTIPDLVKAAPAVLASRGAGFIDLQGQRILIRTPAPSPDVNAIGDGILAVRANTPIRLRDVATIIEEPTQRLGDALIQGRPGVLLALSSQYGANTLASTTAVEHELTKLMGDLPLQGIALYPALHQPATFIERALGNLGRALALTAILILAVLYAFLRDWRAALISLVSIPLSLLTAIALLDWFGYTLNTMTLSGFILALGVLVDDAVISVENILRRLRENAQEASPRERLDVIREASLEVHGPILYATLVVLAVFVPELVSSSVQGRLVGPLALAFMLAVTASLLVALTTTPALSALLLSPKDAHVDPGWLSTLKKAQARAIAFIERHLEVTIALVGALFMGSLLLLPFLGGAFVPELHEGHLVVRVTSDLPGTSLDEMIALGKRMSRDFLALPYVGTVEQQVGRGDDSADIAGPDESEFHIELDSNAHVGLERAEGDLRTILAHYPGMQSEVVTFLGDRISESLTGETAQVSVKLFGTDLNTLDKTAARVVRALGPVQGLVDLQFKREADAPMLDVKTDPAALAAEGVKTQDVFDTIATDYAGTTVGEAFAGARTVDVVILLSDQWRHAPEQLGELMIGGSFGPVPLSSVAHIVPSSGRYSIKHEDGSRYVTVSFNVAGRSLQSVVADAQENIQRAGAIPDDVQMQITGAAAAERGTRFELIIYFIFTLVIVLMVLTVGFRWRAHPFLVMANLPFSLIGSILAIAATGIGLSLGSVVGLVTVFGISARNAILLLSDYEELVDFEGHPWTVATVQLGASERLTPILMTAILTAIGLVPLALIINLPGGEISGPLAVTVLGGLATSTVLNLLLLPALAARYSLPGKNALVQASVVR